MKDIQTLELEVTEIVRKLDPSHSATPNDILLVAELELDSLQMVELIDLIKARFGIDFLATPEHLECLRCPKTISKAVSDMLLNRGPHST